MKDFIHWTFDNHCTISLNLKTISDESKAQLYELLSKSPPGSSLTFKLVKISTEEGLELQPISIHILVEAQS